MFAYDKVYDRLFANEEFVDILCKFHTSNWEKLNKAERIAVLQEFVNKYVEILEIGDMKLKGDKRNKHYSGSYYDIGGLVNFNEDAVEKSSQYDIMDTLFHELRHNFQRRAVAKNLSRYETVSEEDRKLWKLNFLVSPRGYGNYISTEGENAGLYYYQPVERDAFMTGFSLTRKAYELVKERMGEDVEYILYARPFKNLLMIYFSDEEKYVNNMKEMQKRVFEIFESNNKEREIEKKCMEIAKETMKKDIKDMSMEEIMSLFSMYVWAYLDDDYKLELLFEYDSRVNKYKKAKITKESNSGFKVCGVINTRDNIGTILNNLFSFEFAGMVEMMIHGKMDCDPELREELAVNMWMENKKRINYIADSENFLLYSMQPYALHEGKTIKKWFEKIKEVQQKVYGVDGSHWDHWIDFYDNDKYIPYIEKFYEKPFEEIYGELVAGMKAKVKEVRKK